MKMVIREYWNKVENTLIDGSAILRKVLPEYELKDTVTYPEGSGAEGKGYASVEDMQKELRHRFPLKYMGLIPNGVRFDNGKAWGIHSYLDVTLE